MFKLIQSIFKRVITAVTSPFRMMIVRVQRMFNINVITAKLISPLTKKVRELITLRPQSKEDYYIFGKHWVYKKLFLTIILVVCAGVLIYFNMFAAPLPAVGPAAAVTTAVSFRYNDMALREFSGVANICAADSKVIYTGDIEGGICKGVGSLYDHGGKLLYTGMFDQNKYNGKGISYYPSGKVKYEGEFVDNLYQGTGSEYSTLGVLQYVGDFKAGVYSGSGKSYADKDILLYEGNFSNGKYHGDGVLYYKDGTTKYEGTFFQGMMQGKGIIYDKTGKVLYTGDVYENGINYRSLIHSTLADIETAFAETPRIFYTDTDSAFVYEQAGIIVTTSCRVLVDTWEKPAEEKDNSDLYYLPEASDYALEQQEPAMLMQEDLVGGVSPISSFGGGLPISHMNLSLPLGGDLNGIFPKQMKWYVAGGEASDGGQGAGMFDESPSDNSSSSSSSSSSSPSSPSSSNSSPASPNITVVVPDKDKSRPEFMQKSNTLYFEIDKDVWQSEEELDKTKVQIQKITVFNGEIGAIIKDGKEFKDNVPPSMEDCVAIDFIRKDKPTAFPQIMFEMDNQNRLYIKLSNINFASSIRSRAFLAEGLTYRYSYPGNGESPLFFSLER